MTEFSYHHSCNTWLVAGLCAIWRNGSSNKDNRQQNPDPRVAHPGQHGEPNAAGTSSTPWRLPLRHYRQHSRRGGGARLRRWRGNPVLHAAVLLSQRHAKALWLGRVSDCSRGSGCFLGCGA